MVKQIETFKILEITTIEMYIGTGEMTIKEAYDAYKADKLSKFDKE